MKYVGSLLIFSVALFLGYCGAGIESVVNPYLSVPAIEVAESDPETTGIASNPRGIYVMYAGTIQGANDEPYLKFIIYNGVYEPLQYFGYRSNHSFPLLTANGRELTDTNYCWNRSHEYTIPSGQSAEIFLSAEEFLTKPAKAAGISVGFYLWSGSDLKSKVYHSEPLLLPEKFRSSIVKSQ